MMSLGAAVTLVVTGYERGWMLGMVAASGLFTYWAATRGAALTGR